MGNSEISVGRCAESRLEEATKIGSSPNRVGRKSPVKASKPLDFQGVLLLFEVRNPA
jgi:hypothetical protein